MRSSDLRRVSLRLESFRTQLAAIAAGGLVLRLVYVHVLERGVRGLGDWHFFHSLPNLMAEGRGFVDPFILVQRGEEVATALHPPLWPLVLTPVSWLGGESALAHRTVGCVLGAAVIVLLGLLGRRIGGERAGLVAAGIGALHPLLIAADGSLMSETLYGLLVLTALLLALRMLDTPGRLVALGLGLAIGLAALTRSEALLLLPLLALPVAFSARPGRWARVGLACLGCALVVLPWTARNLAAFDRPVLVSHNDSTVFAGANCDRTYGGQDLGGWNLECISERRTDLDEGEQAEIWREEGLEYARDHAGELPGVLAVRVLRTWSLWQPRRQLEFGEGRARWAETAGVIAYFLLVPFAIWGAVLLWRADRAPLLVLLSPVVLVLASSLVAYGVPRFRHAADLCIVVLAAYAVSRRWPERT
jgi:4-amino-4-deoxy-L-arabinose transferase-like glycosyltransferase